jgi:hypothetical protein
MAMKGIVTASGVVLGLLLVLVGAPGKLPAAAGPPEKGKKPCPPSPAALGRDLTDFLPLLSVKDKGKLSDGQRKILEQLEKSKVPTADKAKSAATKYKFQGGGILAEEAPHVVSLLPLGIDVPDFGKRDDLIWVVQFRVFRGAITQEVWVSSSTGAALGILPLKR